MTPRSSDAGGRRRAVAVRVVPVAGRAWQPGDEIDRRRGGDVALHRRQRRPRARPRGASTSPGCSPSSSACQRATGSTSPTGAATPTSGSTDPGPRSPASSPGSPRAASHVRGLVWRSHPDQAHFSEQENLHLVETVNEAGGEVLLDERVRRDGSHHQKLFVVRHPDRPDDDVAFVGGIDLCHGRRDDERHRATSRRSSSTPATDRDRRGTTSSSRCAARRSATWRGRSASGGRTRRRSTTATRGAPRLRRVAGEPRRPDPAAADARRPRARAAATPCRCCARTRPSGRRTRSPRTASAASPGRTSRRSTGPDAWSTSRTSTCGPAPPRGSSASGCAPSRACTSSRSCRATPTRTAGCPARRTASASSGPIEQLPTAGGDRVAFFDLEAPSGWPIYVHSKVCVIDDVWMIVGSDNLNLRSWTQRLRAVVRGHRRSARRPRAASTPAAAATAPACSPARPACGCGASTSAATTATTTTWSTASRRSSVLRQAAAELDAWRAAVRRSTAPARSAAHAPTRTGARGGRRGGRSRSTGSSSTPTADRGRCAAPDASDAALPSSRSLSSGSAGAPALDEAEDDLGNFRQHEVADHRDEADPPLVARRARRCRGCAAGRRWWWPGT